MTRFSATSHANVTRIAIAQMQSGIDPAVNAQTVADLAERSAGEGAAILFTPEMTGLLDRDRKRAASSIVGEDSDLTLAKARDAASKYGLMIALGSLALKGEEDGLWVNRSLLIESNGDIAARYDKLHMFDVDLDGGESWRESNAYQAGRAVTVAQTPAGKLGLSICYDIRFPALFEELGKARCDLIAVPAAFTVPTGQAHWHVLQRARAIEASAYVVAAAQVGQHADGRTTYGHSLVVDPWGEVLLDLGGDGPNIGFAEIDAERIEQVRSQVPSLANRRPIPRLVP